ncbi:hypothetical protein CPB85DRAFT_1413748 [Mucidula mucida]|nr:hypothetical protein CPB85DRAFT_1413748 [Mucidula mucida]
MASSSHMLYLNGAESYCALCDVYLLNCKQRTEHIINSSNHPECCKCGRRFLNRQALQQHYVNTLNHFYCGLCDKHMKSPGGFRVHNEHFHPCDIDYDSDEDDDDHSDDLDDDWEDEEAKSRYPDEAYPPTDPIEDASVEDDSLAFEDEEDAEAEPVCCPMCDEEKSIMCATACGHVFCVRCVTAAIKYIGVCPICEAEAREDQLRRVYIS